MSTEQTCETNSNSPNATEELGEQLGKRLRGSEVIELSSDLGGGKTTFVRGLVRGMGSPDRVSSPTFTISKVYKADKLELHHFDFYRLAKVGLIEHELNDLLGDPTVVVVIEWGGIAEHVLPANRLTITLKPTGEDSRRLSMTYPETLNYLVTGL